jgi:hypothetical protein
MITSDGARDAAVMFVMRRVLLCLVLLTSGAAVAGSRPVPVVSATELRAESFPGGGDWTAVPPAALDKARREISRDPQVTLAAARFTVERLQQDGQTAGYFVTDQVIGKFEKIDYAVVLAADGRVRAVRVLKYRESHGHEVAELGWLAQFAGRSAQDPLKAGRDIDGITGATLSVVHLSEGVRRVTRLVAALQASGF